MAASIAIPREPFSTIFQGKSLKYAQKPGESEYYHVNIKDVAKAKVRAKPISGGKRAGLHFPVGRIHRILRNGHFTPRIGITAPVALAAVLEYVAAEVLELACEAATQYDRRRISPRHIMLAMRKDIELDILLDKVIISQAGVLPNIQLQLLPKETKKTQDAESQEY